MRMQKIILIIVGLAVLSGGAYVLMMKKGANDTVMKDGSMMEGDVMKKEDDVMMKKDEGAMMDKEDGAMEEGGAVIQKGSYSEYGPEKLALANDGKVVLFFHAAWCPVCKAIEAEILANPSRIPDGVHILKVDYDSNTALRQKYGVTYQYTFVQVDASGAQIKKHSASTLDKALAGVL